MKRGFGWKRMMLVVALAPVAVLTSGCKTDGGTTGGLALAEPVEIVEGMSGSSDALKTAGTYLITSQAQWESGGFAEACPGPIDFAAHDVVVVAMGEQATAGYWVRIDAIQQAGTELAVQCTMNKPGADAVVATVVTYPFHAVMVPKTGAALAVPDPTFVSGQER